MPQAQAAGAENSGKLDRALLLTASVVVLGSVMSILDVTVVNVALNTLARDFQTPLTTIQWVATAYTLALAGVIPLTAWGVDRFGTKRLYIISIGLFVLGSAVAGTAWDARSLIFFRVLQGVGGGMLMPIGMIILTRAAGPHRVGRVMSVIGIPILLGPICGPVLGGWLVDSFSWRWIFYINLPLGAIALVLAVRILPRDVGGHRKTLDYVGLALLSPGLALLIYGLAQLGAQGGLVHAQVLFPAITGCLLLGAFVVHGLRTTDALVDLRLFKNKVFSASIVTMVLMIVAVFGGMLLLPLYLQIVRGESALNTGLLLAPQGIGAVIAMPIAGQLADRTGVGRLVPAGLLVVLGSFCWMTQLRSDTSFFSLSIALFFMGLGMGFTMMPAFTGALQTLTRASLANANTLLNITQQVAASIGTSVMVVILTSDITARLGTSYAGHGGKISELAQLKPEEMARVRPLIGLAFGATFWWAVGLVVVALVVAISLLPRSKPPAVEFEEEFDAVPAVMLH